MPVHPDAWFEIDGWLSLDEGRVLQGLAAGRDVLELGTWRGRSCIAMAATARHIVTVDSHQGDVHTGPADTWQALCDTMDRTGAVANVTARRMRLEDLSIGALQHFFDLVFVDATHTAEAVERDTRIALAAVKPGGIIAYHDWATDVIRGANAAGVQATPVAGSLAIYCVPQHDS